MPRESLRYARSTDGVRIAWAICGEGPQTMVMAANHITDIKRDWDNPLRRPALEKFSNRFRVVRYDHRGCGSSQRSVERQGLDAWVEDLEAVVDAAGLDQPFILLGLSQGARTAAAYAARHPQRVSHLVLYGAVACGAHASGEADHIAREEAILELMRLTWGADYPGGRMLVASGLIADATTEEMAWFNAGLPQAARTEDAIRFFRANSEGDSRPILGRIRTPTLVMQTEADGVVRAEWGQAFAAAIPHAAYVELPGRNHIPRPRDPGFAPFFEQLDKFVALQQEASPLDALTARERQILEAVWMGLSNEAIGLSLGISVKTVRNHLTSIFDKLQVNSRTQAAMLVVRSGASPLRQSA